MYVIMRIDYVVFRSSYIGTVLLKCAIIPNNNIYYIVLFARATIDDPFIRTIEVM